MIQNVADRGSRLAVFCRKTVLKKVAKFTGCSFFIDHLRTAFSILVKGSQHLQKKNNIIVFIHRINYSIRRKQLLICFHTKKIKIAEKSKISFSKYYGKFSNRSSTFLFYFHFLARGVIYIDNFVMIMIMLSFRSVC